MSEFERRFCFYIALYFTVRGISNSYIAACPQLSLVSCYDAPDEVQKYLSF